MVLAVLTVSMLVLWLWGRSFFLLPLVFNVEREFYYSDSYLVVDGGVINIPVYSDVDGGELVDRYRDFVDELLAEESRSSLAQLVKGSNWQDEVSSYSKYLREGGDFWKRESQVVWGAFKAGTLGALVFKRPLENKKFVAVDYLMFELVDGDWKVSFDKESYFSEVVYSWTLSLRSNSGMNLKEEMGPIEYFIKATLGSIFSKPEELHVGGFNPSCPSALICNLGTSNLSELMSLEAFKRNYGRKWRDVEKDDLYRYIIFSELSTYQGYFTLSDQVNMAVYVAESGNVYHQFFKLVDDQHIELLDFGMDDPLNNSLLAGMEGKLR